MPLIESAAAMNLSDDRYGILDIGTKFPVAE